MQYNLDLIFILSLLLLGYVFGSLLEWRHYRSIRRREAGLIHQATVPSEALPLGDYQPIGFVSGSVVISVDYFKRLLASLRNIFGGRVSAYETLIDRARREAVLRMKESCPDADMFLNVRIETAAVGAQHLSNRGVACLEVCAYGTAVRRM